MGQEELATVILRQSPFDPPVETALGLLITLAGPGNDPGQIEVWIDAAVTGYAMGPSHPAPGVEYAQLFGTATTPETVELTLDLVTHNTRDFKVRNVPYRIRYLAKGSDIREGQAFDNFEFLVTKFPQD